MITMKTSDLTGAALDWAVAKCEGHTFAQGWPHLLASGFAPGKYSTAWAQGGPIIERIKGFEFKQWLESKPESCCEARIHNYEGDWIQFGATPLIAAMRCYVASKLGDTIDIPEGFTK